VPGEPSFAYAYALRQREDDSTDSETVSDLIETIYTSQDEHRRRQAALRLGGMGTATAEVFATLTYLLEATQDEETRWSAAETLWRLDPNNLVSGIRRVNAITF
jgi:hypothetical protein